jgi:hypothetical protein
VSPANGTHKDVPVSVPNDPPIDCFYAYPTVADDYVGNAPLKVEAPERETAITQAARFSHVCRVYGDRTPPASANFQHANNSSQHVLCVNPAALSGGNAPITPIFAGINPQGIVPYGRVYVTHHWVEFPGLYTAKCIRNGSRAWLLVSRITHPVTRGRQWSRHSGRTGACMLRT